MKFKDVIIRVLPFLGIFIVAWIVTGIVINRGDGVEKNETTGATFPVLYMEKDGEKHNIVRGYKGDMD